MITDIPTAEDYKNAGIAYLNLAWGSIIGLILQLDDSGVEDCMLTNEESFPDAYWKAAQKPLSAAASLLQQGTELLIKSRIASVSPFLLIAGTSRDWPKKCDINDTPFSDFKTVDSHDLIRIHNTVLQMKLDDAFYHKYEESRRMRNVLMHSVDPRIRLTAKLLLLELLYFFSVLVPDEKWIKYRQDHLDNNPDSIAYSSDYVGYVMSKEFMKILSIFEPKEIRTYFSLDKKQRFYICSNCQYLCEDAVDTNILSAQLKPNGPKSTNLYCFICGENNTVKRKKCMVDGCSGNVIAEEDNVCMTCGESQQNEI